MGGQKVVLFDKVLVDTQEDSQVDTQGGQLADTQGGRLADTQGGLADTQGGRLADTLLVLVVDFSRNRWQSTVCKK
jgi:hypothetical protein